LLLLLLHLQFEQINSFCSMATFQGLIAQECGTTNPLIQLSQLYTRDATNVRQDGVRVQSQILLHSTDPLVEEYHQPIVAPQTFHLDGLLSGLQLNDQIAPNRNDDPWTKEFFQRPAVPMPISTAAPITTTSLLPYQPMIYHDQIMPTYHQPAPSQAAQELLQYLQQNESNPTVEMEIKTSQIEDSNATLSWLNSRMFSSTNWSQAAVNSSDLYSEYKFTDNNPYAEHSKPFEEGLRRLAIHDIVNAALFFEAAVKQKSDHIDAWLYLGITQCENEQDRLAICALKKCIELDPKNLSAYLTIASCYANESLIDNAMHALQQWLLNHDEYSHLLKNCRLSTRFDSDYDIDFLNESLFDDLQQALLQAITSSPNQIDADLQTCLGILFHLSSDYEKAAECFQTAVMTKPNDARLWNKLGAALANGGQSEKAVDAYYQALSLSPGFVRARYNLGISCFNLKAFQPAVEHFLTALKQQSEGIGPDGNRVQMSENIWRTLSLALGNLQRNDLEKFVVTKDLKSLLQVFHIE